MSLSLRLGLTLGNPTLNRGVPELFIPGTTVDASTAPSTTSESPPGQININGNGTANARRDVAIVTEAGKSYAVTFFLSNILGTFSAGTSPGATTYILSTSVPAGAYSNSFTASSSTTWLRWLSNQPGRVVTSISVKETS